MKIIKDLQNQFLDKISNTPAVGNKKIAIVLSGGGVRAAYQVGALKALLPYLKLQQQNVNIILGSSIGAINSLVFTAGSKDGFDNSIELLEKLWLERTFNNTFSGSVSLSFFKAIKTSILQYLSPGPNPSNSAIFNPEPLMNSLSQVIRDNGGLHLNKRNKLIETLGVMTTLEAQTRKGILFVSTHKRLSDDEMKGISYGIKHDNNLNIKHGFASAALPSILPPVEINSESKTIKLVDGGIASSLPVGAAARFGAERVIIVDISGRKYWLERFGKSLDSRPEWEIPAADDSFCFIPPLTFNATNSIPLGKILKQATSSNYSFIKTIGPIYPIFSFLKMKFGSEFAYETLSYLSLNKDYIQGLIELGYEDTKKILKLRIAPEFSKDVK